MAELCRVKIQCVKCYEEFETNIYTLIDRSKDREVVRTIFSGGFNFRHCVRCNNEGIVAYPVEVIDSEKDKKALLIYLEDNVIPIKYDVIEDAEDGLQIKVSPRIIKGFRVNEIIKEGESAVVIYSKNELIDQFNSWGEGADVFPDAPTEDQIKRALKLSLISEREAEIVRRADFTVILHKIIVQSVIGGSTDNESANDESEDITEEEELALNIAVRIQNWLESH